LDGEPVMGIFRRAPRPTPPIRHRQEQIARQEAELREKLERLEHMVTQKRSGAPNESPSRGGERAGQNSRTEKRLNVSLALDEHYPAPSRATRRPRSLRKERRQGQIIFLFLLTALGIAVMWLISHFHS
jgi:hypothetical protein